jgi:hypothetical protein
VMTAVPVPVMIQTPILRKQPLQVTSLRSLVQLGWTHSSW